MRQESCPTCGGEAVTCGHPSALFYPQRLVCRRTMAARGAANLYQQMHKDRPFHDGTFPKDPRAWSDTVSRVTPYHFMDGVSFYAAERDVMPDDDFLTWKSGSLAEHGEPDAAEHE